MPLVISTVTVTGGPSTNEASASNGIANAIGLAVGLSSTVTDGEGVPTDLDAEAMLLEVVVKFDNVGDKEEEGASDKVGKDVVFKVVGEGVVIEVVGEGVVIEVVGEGVANALGDAVAVVFAEGAELGESVGPGLAVEFKENSEEGDGVSRIDDGDGVSWIVDVVGLTLGADVDGASVAVGTGVSGLGSTAVDSEGLAVVRLAVGRCVGGGPLAGLPGPTTS